MEEEEENSQIDDEDVVYLLDEGESLEVIQFDPTIVSEKTWKAGEVINTFLKKYFAQQKELDKIMNFPKAKLHSLVLPQAG